MDPAKVAAVSTWASPKNLRNVRAFIGFANFYRRFIKDFAKIARPLHDLTKKDVPWRWTFVERQAFEALKEAFISKPILTMWDLERATRLETDASAHTTSGVILQLCKDGLWHPVAYRSESLIGAEHNYNTHDRELYAIIRALEDWCHFLEGLPKPFEIWTNHSNLQYWTKAQNLTQRQARWALWLSRFHFTLMHKPGKQNVLADALSRLPGSEVHDLEDNRGMTVLKPEFFRAAATEVLCSTDDLEEAVCSCKNLDATVKLALDKVRLEGSRKLPDGRLEWEEQNGLIYH
jgi:hypothetical protein